MLPIKKIAQAQGLDEEEALEILKYFLEYTKEKDLPVLSASLESGDWASARQRAHSIKGAALNLQLWEIADLAARMEHTCAASDLTGTGDILQALCQRLDEVRLLLAEKA